MKKRNPDTELVPMSDATGHVELPPIPALRTFVLRSAFSDDRVIGAHSYEIDERGVVDFFVFFHENGSLMQAPRLVVTGECEVEEVNLSFPELADEGH